MGVIHARGDGRRDAACSSAEVGSARLEICVADITTLARRCHRQCRQPELARRRRRRRRDPSRGGAGIARRVPNARRLRHRRGQNHARLSAAGEARHPCGRPGVERRRRGRGGIAGLLLSHGARSRRRAPACSIAFPAISTGIYRFPPDRAARIAVGTVAAELAAAPRGIARVVFCCFAQSAADHHIAAFADLGLA